ncbi:hypothetical protein WJX75_000186 [Coccomyxa subellipsoidea]|uniref:WD40 repeat-like protein n=1 Tax=Coccomyxa subellipsoidea TaxID=248742 RepID=A0ABR2YWR2_9CHLO
MLSKVVARVAAAEERERKPVAQQMVEDIREDRFKLSLQDVNTLLQCLWEKREAMEKQEAEASLQLLLQFLHYARSEKTQKLKELQEELSTLDADIHQVQGHAVPLARNSTAELLRKRLRESEEPTTAGARGLGAAAHTHSVLLDGLATTGAAGAARQSQAHEGGEGRMLPPPPHPSAAPPSASGQEPSHQPGSSDIVLHNGRLPILPGPSTQGDSTAGNGLPNTTRFTPLQGSSWQARGGGPAFLLPPTVPAPTLSRAASAEGHLPLANGRTAAPAAPASASRAATATPTPATTNSGSSSGGAAAVSHPPSSSAMPCSSHMSADGETEDDTLRARKRRVVSQFEDLQNCYMKLRRGESGALSANRAGQPGAADANGAGPSQHPPTRLQITANGAEEQKDEGDEAEELVSMRQMAAGGNVNARKLELVQQGETAVGPLLAPGGLAEFSRMLSVFTHCSKLKVVAELPRASARQQAAILSSIEFDRDRAVFATAGVSKRISLFDYANVLAHPNVQQHCPAAELVTRSKLSCLSWNKYVRSHIISSDYEGCVTLWDVDTQASVNEYEAHDKRIWSVDYSTCDPFLFVSGSDDGFIKVWSTKQAAPAVAIDMRANVCCVKYNPASAHEIAVGSADHSVHLYDLRNVSAPVHVFAGHRKAVSYVRYLSSTEVVSASTDSTLRLWNTRTLSQTRRFSGHVNEKNFVGLSVDSEFIACGSETDEVYVYYRALAKPIAKRVFSGPTASGQASEGSQFISAVCWKPQAQVLLAANSQGCIKLMQLTS